MAEDNEVLFSPSKNSEVAAACLDEAAADIERGIGVDN